MHPRLANVFYVLDNKCRLTLPFARPLRVRYVNVRRACVTSLSSKDAASWWVEQMRSEWEQAVLSTAERAPQDLFFLRLPPAQPCVRQSPNNWEVRFFFERISKS